LVWKKSSDGVSRFGLGLETSFLRVSYSKVSGLLSVSKFSGLQTLNSAKKWFIQLSLIQRFFCLLYLQVRNKDSTLEKCKRFEKNWSQKWWRHFYKNFWQNAQILKSRVSISVSEFLMTSRSRIEILSRSWSRRLWSRLLVFTITRSVKIV